MTFEAGSSLLNINAVTARLIDRGRHFHLVESVPNSYTSVPATDSIPVPGPPNPASPPRQDAAVAFVLRPPTIPKEDCGPINEAVHLEWLKGRGAAWISGSPEVQYSKEQGSFRIRVTDTASPYQDVMITESGLAAALDTLEDAALDECVSRHLTEGGDDRLHLTLEGVNKYYCPPRPLADDVVIRGSCTCSSPSPDGFEAARQLLRRLWRGRVTFSNSMKSVRQRVSSALRISVPHEVVLHPSGSDAELIPLAVAAARAGQLGCCNIVNIIVAAGEVGSGSAPAAGGRHFSEYTPCGGLVNNGEVVTDFPSTTTVVELKPRHPDGRLNEDFDGLVLSVIEEQERTGAKPYFVVHAVDGSKTGLRLPSQSLLTALMEKLGERLLIVMDACQCRSEAEELNWFLERNAVVLVTASKFFSAPGFCGAVLVPMKYVNVLADGPAPIGLSDYLTKHEVPPSINALHKSLPAGPVNIGLLLRWECGIIEMEMFDTLGDKVRVAMRDWVYGVRQLVCKRRPILDLIDMECSECEGDETRAGGVNSVVSIKFLKKSGQGHLDPSTLRKMHKLLTIDASKLLPAQATDAERKIVELRCMVGQPVKLGEYGVLRLAIGAPMARKVAQPGQMEMALQEDSKILDKMEVLRKYCEEMQLRK